MAKAYFKCSECGANEAVTGRNSKDAARRAAWSLKNNDVCGGCDRKKWQEKYVEEQKSSAAAAAVAGLPQIVGVSPKQVAYGEVMRARAIAARSKAECALIAFVTDVTSGLDAAPAMIEEIEDAIAAIRLQMDREDSAKFWIEKTPRDFDEWLWEKIQAENRAPIFSAARQAAL